MINLLFFFIKTYFIIPIPKRETLLLSERAFAILENSLC